MSAPGRQTITMASRWRSAHLPLVYVVVFLCLSALILSINGQDATSRSSASTATVILEPVPIVYDLSASSVSAQLRVIGNDSSNTFALNLKTNIPNPTIEFVLQPPSNAKELHLSTASPDESIEIILRAHVIEGSIMNNCTDESNSDGRAQLLAGAFLESSVVGSDADSLSDAYQWEQSYISIDKLGCAIETRMYFQPPADSSSSNIAASIERLTWSAEYDTSLIGGDGSAAFTYTLESPPNKQNESDESMRGSFIQGGSLELIIKEEEEAEVIAQTEPPTSAPSSSAYASNNRFIGSVLILRTLLSVLAVA